MDREETQHIVRNTILLYFDNFDQKAHREAQSANTDIKNFFLIFVPGNDGDDVYFAFADLWPRKCQELKAGRAEFPPKCNVWSNFFPILHPVEKLEKFGQLCSVLFATMAAIARFQRKNWQNPAKK